MFFNFFSSGYRACFLETLAYKFGFPKGSLEFFLQHSLDLSSCLLFYINRGTNFSSGPSTLGWRSPKDSRRKNWGKDSRRKNWGENSGPVLQKLGHIETTSFKKFMTNLRKWKKLTRIPHFPTSTVKPKSYGDKTQMSFFREAFVAFFPTWLLNFQIAGTCTHCVPIFMNLLPLGIPLTFIFNNYSPKWRWLEVDIYQR